jgi:hypothetical protein
MSQDDVHQPIDEVFNESDNGNWSNYGWDAKDGHVADLQSKGIMQILDKVGQDLQRHESWLTAPPWFQQMLNRMNEMEEDAKMFRDINFDVKRLKAHAGFEPAEENSGSDDDEEEMEREEIDEGVAEALQKEIRGLKAEMNMTFLTVEKVREEMPLALKKSQLTNESFFNTIDMKVRRVEREQKQLLGGDALDLLKEEFRGDIGQIRDMLRNQHGENARNISNQVKAELELIKSMRVDDSNQNAQLLANMEQKYTEMAQDVYDIRSGHAMELRDLQDEVDDFKRDHEKRVIALEDNSKKIVQNLRDCETNIAKNKAEIEAIKQNIVDINIAIEEANTSRVEADDAIKMSVEQLDRRVYTGEKVHAENVGRLDGVEADCAGLHKEVDALSTLIQASKEFEEILNHRLQEVEIVHIPKFQNDTAKLETKVQKNKDKMENLNNQLKEEEKTREDACNKLFGKSRNADGRLDKLDREMAQSVDKASLSKRLEEIRDESKEELEKVADHFVEQEIKFAKAAKAVSTIDQRCQMEYGLTTKNLKKHTGQLEDSADETKEIKHNFDVYMEEQQRLLDALKKNMQRDVTGLGGKLDGHATEANGRMSEAEKLIKELFYIEDNRDQPEFAIKRQLKLLAAQLHQVEITATTDHEPALNEPLAARIARTAQDTAALFAKQADQSVMVRELLRNLRNPQGMSFDKDNFEMSVDLERHQHSMGFLVDMATMLQSMNEEPTGPMQQTRVKLINKLRRTIQTALSKHEQVEVTADSLLSTVKLNPVCSACNLPLARKRRTGDGPAQLPEDIQVGVTDEVREAMFGSKRPFTADTPRSFPDSPMSARSNRSNKSVKSQASTMNSARSGVSSGTQSTRSSVMILNRASGGKEKMVNRGGFKMPKPGSGLMHQTSSAPVFEWNIGATMSQMAQPQMQSGMTGGTGRVGVGGRPSTAGASSSLPKLS